MAFFKQGKFMLVCGTLGKDARHRVFDSGKSVANFTVKYDVEENLVGDNGARKGLYVDVKAWGSRPQVYELACCLEKGDVVQVIGELKREPKPDRDGNVKWYLDAEFIEVQQTVQAEENQGETFDENTADDEPLPEKFAETNCEYGGGGFPEALQ